MNCECVLNANRRRRKRIVIAKLQMLLPFPEEAFAAAPKRIGPDSTVMLRQPSRFPPNWFRLSIADPNWRYHYEQRWIEDRRRAGHPHTISNPTPRIADGPGKITSRSVAKSAGNAVPGPLCDPRRMTA